MDQILMLLPCGVVVLAVIIGAVWGSIPKKWRKKRPRRYTEADSIDLFDQDIDTINNEYEDFLNRERHKKK